ncbi:hypothetical protein PSTG_00564 [Puccinia striiformis f. sp. tritici PST-78]|uniref:Uncharacterized protein n=1 Tax=Puccinia striiformis f. sp. tritici PST-78 TaxID=1165861 RepID=A0A0L0W3J3_9BASI|nr:hypothetical protein PSTG_00564 [Puccinia striiformis f. sp. tritici PST-78]
MPSHKRHKPSGALSSSSSQPQCIMQTDSSEPNNGDIPPDNVSQGANGPGLGSNVLPKPDPPLMPGGIREKYTQTRIHVQGPRARASTGRAPGTQMPPGKRV